MSWYFWLTSQVFFQVYIIRYYHNKLFEVLDDVNIKVFTANGLWIFFCSLMPFTTRWVGENPDVTHAEGSNIIMQLFHGSSTSQAFPDKARILGPSTVRNPFQAW
jgi:uncharacterized membrane protein